ncbi:MAG: c-type cytochrome [Pseudomonadota bacterium]
MRNKFGLSLGFVLMLFTLDSSAASFPRAEKIVSQTCAACHGADGNSVIPENPVLAGQVPEYIERQLKNFKSDVRPNPIMKGMAASLTPEDMKELGGFFGSQKIKAKTSKAPDLVEQGKVIFRFGNEKSGLPACMGCHGPAGAGVPTQYPRLAGQHASYILKQLKSFRKGERGANKSDISGKIMVDVAKKLSEEEMTAVAEYISALK